MSYFSILVGQQQVASWVLVVAAVAIFLLFLTCFLVFGFAVGRPWMMAFLAGKPISLVQVLAMRLRRSDVKSIIHQGTVAFQAGHPVDYDLLEVASREGLDLETVTAAYCVSQENGLGHTFKDIMVAARESKLDDLMSGR